MLLHWILVHPSNFIGIKYSSLLLPKYLYLLSSLILTETRDSNKPAPIQPEDADDVLIVTSR